MSDIEHEKLELAEIEAFRDFYRAAPASLLDLHAIEVARLAGGICMSCRGFEPTPVFRRVAGLGVGSVANEDDLSAILHHMAGRDQPYCVNVTPHARPVALARWLGQRGFTRGYAWMKFFRPCAEPSEVSTDLDIRVAGKDCGEAFAVVVTDGYGLSPELRPWLAALPGRENWICVLAYLDDLPVGAGAAYLDGDCAWLGFGATLSVFRHRGSQSAILARRLKEAADRGARLAVVETGEWVPGTPSRSYRNILRAGFREAYLRENYLSPLEGVPAA
jgi:hypothetical protein